MVPLWVSAITFHVAAPVPPQEPFLVALTVHGKATPARRRVSGLAVVTLPAVAAVDVAPETAVVCSRLKALWSWAQTMVEEPETA